MKKYLFLIITAQIFNTGCKKLADSPAPAPTYDASNRIMRVKASTDNNLPFNIIVSEIHSTSAGSVENQEVGQQNTGSSFEYPFTPTIGDSIKVVVQSIGNPVYVYVLYKGVVIKKLDITRNSNGSSYGMFEYQVAN